MMTASLLGRRRRRRRRCHYIFSIYNSISTTPISTIHKVRSTHCLLLTTYDTLYSLSTFLARIISSL
jgi:hypothetical protein